MTLEAIERAVAALSREDKARLLGVVLAQVMSSVVPTPAAPAQRSPEILITAQELADELGHDRDWVYREAKRPGTLVAAARVPTDGRPRFSRQRLERARRARALAADP